MFENTEKFSITDSVVDDFENRSIREIIQQFGKLLVANLDASSRLSIANTKNANDPQEPPQNLLQAMYVNQHNLMKELKEIFSKTFDKDIELDDSANVQLKFRTSRKFEPIPTHPKEKSDFFQKYDLLDDQGEGFKSFVGVILSLLLCNNRIILLDEPEAFLHPTQARILGRWISEYSKNLNPQIFIATHNSNFLAGLLSGGEKLDVFRLNRNENSTRVNQVSSEAISNLINSPLLSSQPVHEALFYDGVVVCEGDSDRIFYQKFFLKKHKIENILFIHTHGKQTIKEILTLLKDVQVPVSTIVDIDILNSKENFKLLLESVSCDKIDSFLQIRSKISEDIAKISDSEIIEKIELDLDILLEQVKNKKHDLAGLRGALDRIETGAKKWRDIKKLGLDGVPKNSKKECEKLIDDLKKWGIFVVPVGQLESWFPMQLTKKNWIISALEKIEKGEYPDNLSKFTKELSNYFNSPTNQPTS